MSAQIKGAGPSIHHPSSHSSFRHAIFSCSISPTLPPLSFTACTQQACLKCCTDEQCEPHREQREKEKEKELILDGKDPLQIRANKQRALAIKPGAFHEPAFRYLNETLLIWDLKSFMKNAKWRDDAIRKSRRYVESQLYLQSHPKGFKRKQFQLDVPANETRKKRFKRVMDHLHKNSLK